MDKYSILTISIIALIFIFSYFQIGEDEESVTGFADGLVEKDSGYVFYIHDSNGNSIKAYSSSSVDGVIHTFYGNYSSDGSIFFVNEVK